MRKLIIRCGKKRRNGGQAKHVEEEDVERKRHRGEKEEGRPEEEKQVM